MIHSFDECRRRVGRGLGRFLLGSMIFFTIILILGMMAKVWPYDDIRYGSYESKVLTKQVEQGGIVMLENPSYCNDDQDAIFERWADLIGDDGKVLGSYQLFSVVFYNEGGGLQCFVPARTALTLPNYVIGPNGTAGTFRIRYIVTYHPNPMRDVTITITSGHFRVVPVEEAK